MELKFQKKLVKQNKFNNFQINEILKILKNNGIKSLDQLKLI